MLGQRGKEKPRGRDEKKDDARAKKQRIRISKREGATYSNVITPTPSEMVLLATMRTVCAEAMMSIALW
jgi:hypothetical protein